MREYLNSTFKIIEIKRELWPEIKKKRRKIIFFKWQHADKNNHLGLFGHKYFSHHNFSQKNANLKFNIVVNKNKLFSYFLITLKLVYINTSNVCFNDYLVQMMSESEVV